MNAADHDGQGREALVEWKSRLLKYVDGVAVTMPLTADGFRELIDAMPDLKAHDAEVAAGALRDASKYIGDQRDTITGRRKANAETFGLLLWYRAEEVEWQAEHAGRRASADTHGDPR